MNVKKRFRPFLLPSWKQLLFKGFHTSEMQFRNCGNCVQTLLFLLSVHSSLVRGNEREKTVWNLHFTLLKAAAFWRFCHIWHTFSKLRKLCSDIRPLFVIKAIVSETLFAPRREAAVAAGATCSVMFILCTYYVLIISQLKLCSKRKNLGKFLIESKKFLYLSSKCLLCICYVIIIVNEFSCKNTLRFISIIINIQ